MSADVEDQLKILSERITKLRAKANQLRSQAAATDAQADAMVKEAAVLGTGSLPLLNRTGMEGDPRGSYTADGTFRMD